MALHEQSVGKTDEWYTPKYIFDAMGRISFDMDVASPEDRTHCCVPAKKFITRDSLITPWKGFVWMNPPFGGRNALDPWLDKFFRHKNGIALVPDRTSAPWWQAYAPKSDAVLFVKKKIQFIGADGVPGKSPAQGTCLLASGDRAIEALRRAEASGLGVLFKNNY